MIRQHWLKLIFLSVGATAGLLVGIRLRPTPPPQASSFTRVYDIGPTIEQVQKLSTLLVSRVQVADVLETHVAGFSGGVRTALLLKGDFELGVDLAGGRFQAVNPAARTAVLILPPPAAASPRVDHERTRLFSISEYGLWRLVPDDTGQTATVNQAYRSAQEVIARIAADSALVEQSRRRVEQVLGDYFNALDWKVRIRWTDRPVSDPAREDGHGLNSRH